MQIDTDTGAISVWIATKLSAECVREVATVGCVVGIKYLGEVHNERSGRDFKDYRLAVFESNADGQLVVPAQVEGAQPSSAVADTRGGAPRQGSPPAKIPSVDDFNDDIPF